MSPTKIKIDPAKMSRRVRFLFETCIIKNLSPYKVAPFLRVSPQQIYRWFSGDAPTPGSEALIEAGLELIKDLPNRDGGWGESWIDDTPERRKEKAAEEKFHAQMKEIFGQLQRKARPEEIELMVQEEPAWTGLEEMLLLLKKHGIKLPN